MSGLGLEMLFMEKTVWRSLGRVKGRMRLTAWELSRELLARSSKRSKMEEHE